MEYAGIHRANEGVRAFDLACKCPSAWEELRGVSVVVPRQQKPVAAVTWLLR
jgi:hypothetical protein